MSKSNEATELCYLTEVSTSDMTYRTVKTQQTTLHQSDGG